MRSARQASRVIGCLASFAIAVAMLGVSPLRAHASTSFPYTIWSSSTLPYPLQAADDSPSIEVGVKFRTDIAGSVIGVRFYKDLGNTGTHLGNLWSSTGSLLATATFTNETGTGWQQVNFPAPVPIDAGTTYIASYFAPNGHYAAAPGFFLSGGVDNPPLHALVNGLDGPNGMFSYSSSSAFPTSSFGAANYWVDVVFTATVTTPPVVTAKLPAPGATNVALNPQVTATFSEEVDPSTISFVLRTPTGEIVPAQVTYELYAPGTWSTPSSSPTQALSPSRGITLQPNLNLATSTTYTATLTSATDRSGNPMTSPVSWSFSTTAMSGPPPQEVGLWNPVQPWPMVAIHSAVLSTGNVLQWDLQWPSTRSQTWNPLNNTFTTSTMPYSSWCAGQVQLADGRLLQFGGDQANGPANNRAAIYDPASNTWSRVADMNVRRWYPAGTRLNDGRVVVISGGISGAPDVNLWADTPEVYDPASNTWTLLSRVNTSDMHEDLYPNSYLLPNGKVFVYAMSFGHTRILDVAAQTWTPGPTSPIFNGSSVMYAPGKFIVSGGTAQPSGSDAAQGVASVAQAAILDMTVPNPAWQMVSPMNFARGYHNLMSLPDGKVLAVGGAPIFSTAAAVGVLPAELWDPATGQWTTMAAARDPRMNHSTAHLLPSGAVLASGGGHEPGFNPYDYFTAEVFVPPYLTTTVGPQISSAPTSTGYGATIAVGTANPGSIASVSLMGLPAQTHKFDTSASYIPLSFSPTSTGLNVTIPSTANQAPPGYYMLFLVDNGGVPSVARMIQLVGPDLIPPAVAGAAPTAGATGVSSNAAPAATFSKPVQPSTIAFSLKDQVGNPVSGTVNYNSAMDTVTFTPSSQLAFSTMYTATVSGAKDLAGTGMTAPFSWSFTTAPLSCPCSLWSSSTVPAVPASGDPNSVEVGVKFRPDMNGFITGIRFYKGAGNTGTHIGNLWSATGQLLASAVFTGETASGWQQVNFEGGVPVTAGTTYVASYFAPAGNYAADSAYFANAAYDNSPLHALANSVSPNGVYGYSSSSTFPTSSFNATNYWVDLVFIAADQLGQVTEYPITTAASFPTEIIAGPDGNLWFTEDPGNKIGRVTTAGIVTEFALPNANSQPLAIAAGADGNLWFTETNGNRIGKITTAGAITEFTVPTTASQPDDITAGPDGNVWFSEIIGNKIGRVTMAGVITEFPVPTAGSLAAGSGLGTGPDGNLWFTEGSGNKIGRITPAGIITEFPIPTAASRPNKIEPGPDGNLWFTEFNTNKIGRITPGGGNTVTEFLVPTSNSGPNDLRAGPDGNMWFTEYNPNINKVARITMTGTIAEFPVQTANAQPGGIAPGPDGNMWFTEDNASKIGKIGVARGLSAQSTQQYSMSGNDGATWQPIDAANLSVTFTPKTNSIVALSGNADLWTAAQGVNQDLGIWVKGGIYGTAGILMAWKESGGYAGTFSPNAAFVQVVVPVSAGPTYAATLVWKTNKPTKGTIYAAAGTGPIYSPTRLTAEVIPTSDTDWQTAVSTQQYALAGNDGTTWHDMDSTGLLTITFTPAASGPALINANADLWTSLAHVNQDIGIFISGGSFAAGQVVAWKESGGNAGTFSPNAADLQTVVQLTGGTPYTIKLQWKTNVRTSGTIYAAAGNGPYSPTRLTLRLFPVGTLVTDAVSTQQYFRIGSTGSDWMPIDVPNLQMTVTPAADSQWMLSGNVDLWTATAGVNQDVGIFVSGGAYGTGTLVAWKESGGFAGTFSPNAAFVHTVLPLAGGITYTVTLEWKANKNTGGTIYAAAGGGPVYSPTRLTAQSMG